MGQLGVSIMVLCLRAAFNSTQIESTTSIAEDRDIDQARTAESLTGSEEEGISYSEVELETGHEEKDTQRRSKKRKNPEEKKQQEEAKTKKLRTEASEEDGSSVEDQDDNDDDGDGEGVCSACDLPFKNLCVHFIVLNMSI